MGKQIKKREPEAVDPETLDALRSAAGWPVVQSHRSGYRARSRHLAVSRDQNGRITGSVEHYDFDEYEEYSETRQKEG